ncbi:MAG: acetate--CoA ligase family protein, partial [Anaerolineae bacterium]|nr:acetate--CoA ligase family protein [Anaerolineae bacterium]
TAILDWALAGRMGFSKFVSLGNKADISEIELLEAWSEDVNSNVTLAYIEGVPDGQRFIETARRASKKKPIVAVKSGVTQAGSRAVSSHTGSLAGSEQAYAAAFRQAGIIRANTMEEMFDYALAFAHQPLPKGNNFAIITNAGGPGILATDALERAGLKLAKLRTETIKDLEAHLPDAASAANPVDVLGDAMADRYEMALDRVSQDPNVDGLIVILTPQAMTNIPGTAEAIVRISQQGHIPVIACFMGEFAVEAGVKILTKNGVPNYPFPERAVTALKAMCDYRDTRAKPLPNFTRVEADRDRVQKVFDRVRADGRMSIGDFEAREVMEAYGLKMPDTFLAETADQAVQIAADLGYPVVMKIASPDILHKTDVGGVRVGLRNSSDVRDAFDLMTYRAAKYVPGARIWGCIVQKMSPQGLELLVGMNRDPQFGPLVTFALGGIYVEILKDATFRIAPFAREEAEAMLGELRARALLDGVRGQPPVDKEAIIDTLMRIGQLVQDFPEIVEMDINPLMVFEKGQGALAIDMRMVLKG